MSSTGRVPLLDENDRFPDRFAPPSVAADAAAAEVARDESVAAASDAEAARDESVAAAVRAEAVPAQVDTAMAEQVGTGGEFDTKLNATIGEEVGTLVPAEVSTALANDPTIVEAAQAAMDASQAWLPSHAYGVGDTIVTPLGHRLRATVAHTSAAVRFTDDLPKWIPTSAPPSEAMLLGRAKTAREGGIGVGSKTVIAFRCDDWLAAMRDTVLPLFTARGIPAGLAMIADLTAQPWAAGFTGADILALNKRGIEIHSHGLDHKDPSPHGLTGAGGLYDQIITSKSLIEAWGVQVQGWMHPGAAALVPGVTPYGTNFTAWESLDQYAAWLIRDTYPVSEMYTWGVSSRPIPHNQFHGADHITISDGMTYATVVDRLNSAIADGRNIEFMLHPGNIGGSGNITLAEFTQFLDLVQVARNDGLIEVLTPSGLFFADRSNDRINLIRGGDFAGMTTGDSRWLSWGNVTVETSGGHSGSNFARWPTGSSAILTQRYANLESLSLDGKTFVFEGWARSNGASNTVPRVLIQSHPSTAALNLSLTVPSVGSTWTRVRHAFTIPPGVPTLLVGLARNSLDGIDWDDVTVKIV